MPASAEAEEDKRRKAAIIKIRGWVESHVPAEHLKSRACVIDIQEAQCGDPDCAPIDTIVRIIYEGNCGTVFGLPCEAWEVDKTDLFESMPTEEYFQQWKEGTKARWPPEPENPEPGEPPPGVELRFAVGDRVECCVQRGEDGWKPGTVVSLWYRAASWPTGQYAPYQIKLDDHESLIFAPQDRDNCIRPGPPLEVE